MADSEEDGSFESADEGDSRTKQAAAAKNLASEVTKNIKSLSMDDEKKAEADPKAAETEKADHTREKTPTRVAHRLKETETKVQDEKKDADEKNNPESVAGAEKPSNWGWGNLSNWGSSALTTASSSVHTFAGSVGDGFQTVLDSIETSLGAPDPEVIAEYKKRAAEAKAAKRAAQEGSSDNLEKLSSDSPTEVIKEPPKATGTPTDTETGPPVEGAEAAEAKPQDDGWFKSWDIGGITKSVQQTMKKTVKDTTQVFQETSKSLVSGSLDVLESIGKKTYDVIAEGDHGFKKTIKSTKQKESLSQILREAKDESDQHSKEEEEYVEKRKAHFGAQFDDFQGLVQLEALEMLSNQCEKRVMGLLQTLKGSDLDEVKKELVAIKTGFELEDMEGEDDDEKDHEFDRLMTDYIGQVGLNTTPERLLQVQEKTRKWLMDCQIDLEDGNARDPKEVHQHAIQTLAELTARIVQLYHKVGQLVLLEKSAPVTSYRTKANSLASATRVLCSEVGMSSVKFTQCLGMIANSCEKPSEINPLITNVYLEASNSSTYIQDAFQLLLPVLQQGVIEAQQRAALMS